MTEVFVNLKRAIDQSNVAIYTYEPEANDTITKSLDLYRYANAQANGNSANLIVWAAYGVMMNPTGKAAVNNKAIKVRSFFSAAWKNTISTAEQRVIADFGSPEYFDEQYQRLKDVMDPLEAQLVEAKRTLRPLRSGNEGYIEARDRVEDLKKQIERAELRYPSERTIEHACAEYLFHFLSGFATADNIKIKDAILDAVFNNMRFTTVKQFYKLGAARNNNPEAIAAEKFRWAVKRGDADKLDYQYNMITRWMTRARRPNGANDDKIFVRQNIADDVWNGYRDAVTRQYQEAGRMIEEGIAEMEAYFDNTEYDDEADRALFEELDVDRFNNITEEEVEDRVAGYEELQAEAERKFDEEGGANPFGDEVEESDAEDEDADMGELSAEDMAKYQAMLNGE